MPKMGFCVMAYSRSPYVTVFLIKVLWRHDIEEEKVEDSRDVRGDDLFSFH
jgi:hypothetical protein